MERGINAIGKLDDGSCVRVVVNEGSIDKREAPTLQDPREALIGVYGTDYGLHKMSYISRFTDMTRQAALYRRGRHTARGDAAHIAATWFGAVSHAPMKVAGRAVQAAIVTSGHAESWKLRILKLIVQH